MTVKEKLTGKNGIFFQYGIFFKWLIISVTAGLVIGAAGAVFHILLGKVREMQAANSFLICLMPIAGLVIVRLYSVCGMSEDKGTNGIILGARGEEQVSLKTAPLIVIATLLTHLTGGSAGREGAALQLGGSLASPLAKLFKLKDDDYSMLTICGMAAGFSALFGTPAAAAVFALEVTVIGLTRYSALVPGIISALTAAFTARLIGVSPTAFIVETIPGFDGNSGNILLRTVVMGIGTALVSILFCFVMETAAELYQKHIPNKYARIFIGGVIVAALSWLICLLTGSFDYNGAGSDIIAKALMGESRPEAFILKLLLTALTLGAGFKGGEIVPALFVGSTFGAFFGGLIGFPPSFGAALGLCGVFCGVTNCPFASLLLAIELFGSAGLPYYVLVIGMSYMLSGYRGLYSAQKFYGGKFGRENYGEIFSYDEYKRG
ncbi:MAG: chloride channel protein [Ruminococcus sp.]|nr:chloride channel protein [Ruminococcus sp.]